MRTVGVIALFALTLLVCRAMAEYEQRRIKTLDALLSLLRYIKTMILCYGTPLGEIFRGIEDEFLEEIGLLGALRESGSLRAALAKTRGSLVLSADLCDRLSELGDAIGRGDRTAAGELCDYYIAELSREASELRAASPKRLRLQRSLVVTGMLMLVIVLI